MLESMTNSISNSITKNRVLGFSLGAIALGAAAKAYQFKLEHYRADSLTKLKLCLDEAKLKIDRGVNNAYAYDTEHGLANNGYRIRQEGGYLEITEHTTEQHIKAAIRLAKLAFYNLLDDILSGAYETLTVRDKHLTLDLNGLSLNADDLYLLVEILKTRPVLTDKLYGLNLANNQLAEMEGLDFSFMPNLRELNLSSNYDLNSLPKGMAQVKNLNTGNTQIAKDSYKLRFAVQ